MKDNGWLVRTKSGGSATRPFFDNKPSGPIFLRHFYEPQPIRKPAASSWEKVRDNYYRKE